ncbi:MAG: hypothetical protein ACJ8FP_00160 [Xanthobacteraceae bacterium]
MQAPTESKTQRRTTRRRLLETGAAAAGTLLAAPFIGFRTAWAAWPERPVRLLVPFGPGGPVDVVARLLQPALTEELKGNFFVENKVGAAGGISASGGLHAPNRTGTRC